MSFKCLSSLYKAVSDCTMGGVTVQSVVREISLRLMALPHGNSELNQIVTAFVKSEEGSGWGVAASTDLKCRKYGIEWRLWAGISFDKAESQQPIWALGGWRDVLSIQQKQPCARAQALHLVSGSWAKFLLTPIPSIVPYKLWCQGQGQTPSFSMVLRSWEKIMLAVYSSRSHSSTWIPRDMYARPVEKLTPIPAQIWSNPYICGILSIWGHLREFGVRLVTPVWSV